MKINGFVPDTKVFETFNKDKNLNKNLNNGFYEMLKGKLNEVNNSQIKASESTEAFIKGDEKNIHNVMLNAEEAKMSMELAVQVRNKLVEAYQELNRMQL
ncbi:flagellar hook-basal body complex protein FliE [Clostridium niameyense]|uniref:Flagellar hook-basal body complex protein FliE n=1 Tax=Clostridium niameyense TaxID=1622073 RepID=A0A6M0R7Z4_9CLOT|nr:flagellar hook-basal body complex protein FliE [Clostridium niameyense]NEZ45887.1 flagellar hook-basal body complex protein FliE [Clostridium niameyense]